MARLGRQARQHRQGLEMLERVNQVVMRPAVDVKSGVSGCPELLQVLPPLLLQVYAAPEDHLTDLIADLHRYASLGWCSISLDICCRRPHAHSFTRPMNSIGILPTGSAG